MPTFRTTIVIDFDVPDETDPDEFHDELRDSLEDSSVSEAINAGLDSLTATIETVRDINVVELDD